MTTARRKINAKHFVSDRRNGMSDRDLMEKYSISENQFHNLLKKMSYSGAIDDMEGSPITTSKRKIGVIPFIRDLRTGIGDNELMEKYVLSEVQLHKVLHKLVDAGHIDDMELFMRTSLSDSTITRAFLNTQCAMEETGLKKETTSLPDLERPSNISLTENVNTTSSVYRRIIAKLGSTGS